MCDRQLSRHLGLYIHFFKPPMGIIALKSYFMCTGADVAFL
jgi:hypothetical protein